MKAIGKTAPFDAPRTQAPGSQLTPHLAAGGDRKALSTAALAPKCFDRWPRLVPGPLGTSAGWSVASRLRARPGKQFAGRSDHMRQRATASVPSVVAHGPQETCGSIVRARGRASVHAHRMKGSWASVARRNASVPALPGRPLVGHLFELRDQRIALLRRVAESHPSVAKLRLGVFEVVLLSEPKLVHALLVGHHDALRMNLALQLFAGPLLGDGLLRLEHEAHRRRRRMLSPAFLPKRIRSYVDDMVGRAERAADRMLRQGQCDMAEESMRVTFDIAGKALFDADIADDAERVGGALAEVTECMLQSMTSILPLPAALPSPNNLRMRRAVARLDAIVYQLLAERRGAGGEGRGDLLSLLLAARDEEDGSALTAREVRDEIMTVYLAGHETTAMTLAWAFQFLSEYPEASARLREEVDQVTGGRPLCPADLPKLAWTLQVLKETMRMRPSVYVLARRTLAPIQLGPHAIAPGSIVAVNIVGMHHRSDLFCEPDRFDPERFSPEREQALPRNAFIPFSVGPRACIGSQFALMEAQVVLATWMRRLTLRPRRRVPPDQEPLLTLRPRGGVPVTVVERQGRRL